ncbi:hypothetical protein ACN4EK_00440 [Pantanalinema rosaneae CENA516]|uniref:hypothetical protein n=1 Tax=Pantanalinema rosaneae TaxID=1620701 RepID=UPI003D700845
MFRQSLNVTLASLPASCLLPALSDSEQQTICGGNNSRPYTGPTAVKACHSLNDMLPPEPGQERC